MGDCGTHLKNTQFFYKFKFLFYKIQGLFKVHESFIICKCDAMYMMFKTKLYFILQ
jgi:hypothetical protein